MTAMVEIETTTETLTATVRCIGVFLDLRDFSCICLSVLSVVSQIPY